VLTPNLHLKSVGKTRSSGVPMASNGGTVSPLYSPYVLRDIGSVVSEYLHRHLCFKTTRSQFWSCLPIASPFFRVSVLRSQLDYGPVPTQGHSINILLVATCPLSGFRGFTCLFCPPPGFSKLSIRHEYTAVSLAANQVRMLFFRRIRITLKLTTVQNLCTSS
jgi:hypothetical protein